MVKVTTFGQKDNHKIKLNSCFIQLFKEGNNGTLTTILGGAAGCINTAQL